MNRFYLAMAIACLYLAPTDANEVRIARQSVGSYTAAPGMIRPDTDSMLVANVSGFVSRSYMVFDANEIDDLFFSLPLWGNPGGDLGRVDDGTDNLRHR